MCFVCCWKLKFSCRSAHRDSEILMDPKELNIARKNSHIAFFYFSFFPLFLTRSLFLPLLSFLCFSFLFLCRRGVSTWKRTWPGETKAHDIKRTVNCRFRRRTVIQQGERSSFISDSGAGIRNPAKQRRTGNLAEKS